MAGRHSRGVGQSIGRLHPLAGRRLRRHAHWIDGDHRDGFVKLVSDLVEIEAQEENWLRYFTPDPHETNPLLLRTLASHEVGVVTLSVVPRSLEDVYLRVVEE